MTAPVQPPVQGQPPATDPRPMTGAELNRRIQHGDQNFPPELWGRTVGEAMRYYQIMRQDFVNRQRAGQQPPLQGQPQQSQVPQAPQPQAPQPRSPEPTGYIPPASPAAPVGFTLEDVSRIVRETMAQSLGPIAQASSGSVQQQMRQRFADWGQYEQAILAELQGVDPTALLNPALWESAYYYAKGKAVTESPPRQPTIYDPQQPPPNRDGAIYQPVPQQFFTEAPTAPSSQPGPGGQVYDPMDEVYARRFGMSVEEYRQWKGGAVPVTQRAAPNGNGGQPPAQGWR